MPQLKYLPTQLGGRHQIRSLLFVLFGAALLIALLAG
jgi:hypothetical protein